MGAPFINGAARVWTVLYWSDSLRLYGNRPNSGSIGSHRLDRIGEAPERVHASPAYPLAVPIACAVLGAGIYSFSAPAKTQELIGRSVSLGGRQLQCNNAPIMVDRTLSSEGAADDEFRILNPDMLKDQPEIVRIFIFKHECGHLTVGDSELAADCFAVRSGRERAVVRPQRPKPGLPVLWWRPRD